MGSGLAIDKSNQHLFDLTDILIQIIRIIFFIKLVTCFYLCAWNFKKD